MKIKSLLAILVAASAGVAPDLPCFAQSFPFGLGGYLGVGVSRSRLGDYRNIPSASKSIAFIQSGNGYSAGVYFKKNATGIGRITASGKYTGSGFLNLPVTYMYVQTKDTGYSYDLTDLVGSKGKFDAYRLLPAGIYIDYIRGGVRSAFFFKCKEGIEWLSTNMKLKRRQERVGFLLENGRSLDLNEIVYSVMTDIDRNAYED